MITAPKGIPFVLFGNALLRIAGSASGVLVGLYLAELSNRGMKSGAALAGTLGAMAYGAEFFGAIPMGLVSDALAPRSLMTAGSLLGAIATQLFGLTGSTGVFFLSRTVEGLGASATAPSLLAHLTDVTDGDAPRRARVMSYFELSLLAGLALGGVLASQLWGWLGRRAFAAVAGCYVVSAALLYFGATQSRGYGIEKAISGFRRALHEPSLRRLAPIWLCVNSIVGLWLGPTLPFLLTERSATGQFLAGVYFDAPQHVGWVLLGYSIVFGAGVTVWSIVLPHLDVRRALRVTLVAMFAACLGFYAFNHSGQESSVFRWVIACATGVCIMVESGFTPAALSLLAGAVGAQAGRGAAMGIYSVLLSLGAIAGSLLAGWLGTRYAVDGLIFGTFGMATAALLLVRRMGPEERR
jgi:MFS family permease